MTMPDQITRLYRSCDPDTPLQPGDPRYVSLAKARGELPGDSAGWRDRVARDIRRAEQSASFLISGFSGDGKSTEILRLRDDLIHNDPRMAVVYVDCSQYLNPYAYSFTDVLLAIIAETGRQLRKEPYSIELRPGYLSRKIDEITKTLFSTVELEEIGLKAADDTFEVSAKIGLQARDNDVIRQKLWDALAGDRKTLAQAFKELINEEARPQLKEHKYQDLVIIVDWLEKLVDFGGEKDSRPGAHKELFLHHSQLIQSLGAHLVLTLPIDLVYSSVQEQLTMAYGRQPITINAVRVDDFFDPEERDEGRKTLREFLRLRCEHAPDSGVALSDLFTEDELIDELIVFSGGHPRGLLILMRQCCSFSSELPITREAFLAAKRQATLAASRKVKEAWYPLLAKIHLTGEIENDVEHLEMLRTLCVFCYANGEPTYRVDPPILGLKKMKRAIEELESQ